MEKSTIPPNAIELEEVVLGALLLESSQCAHTVTLILRDDNFYLDKNKIVYRAIIELFNKSEVIDILTVTQKVKEYGKLDYIGGAYYISSLTNNIASSANIEYHARIIQQKYLLRELILLGLKVQQSANYNDADCFKIIEAINKTITGLTTFITSNVKKIDSVFSQMVTEISNVIEKGLPTGLLTGYKNIDEITGGWQKGNLIVLASRPGMGKTALALNFAKHPAVELKKPVAIFSLEMTATELVGRMASAESNVYSNLIIQKKISRNELQEVSGSCYKLIESNIYIDDTSGITFADLKSRAKKLHYEQKIELIIIDYLQLMGGDLKGNREQEISYITRNLKSLAKELDLPIIVLSQLSRNCESRPDKRPQLSDLRESGAIEQDADIVMFIWRPEYYNLCEQGYEYGVKVLPNQNLAMLDIAKGRGIQTCEIPLRFYGQYMRFENYELNNNYAPVDFTEPLRQNDEFLNS